jgi:propanol-preferring alcohol dehydrogenase
MRAMILAAPGTPLVMRDLPERHATQGEIRLKVSACGVCRTDLHVADGDLPNPKLPIIPGHEIVGYVDEIGPGVERFALGDRVGVPWLGHTCGLCSYCLGGRENLCDRPLFTGYTRDGGYATQTIAEAHFAFPLRVEGDDAHLAPFLCAGLIGWRSLVATGEAKNLGIYGFGAAAHIITQVARWEGRSVFAFTRPGDDAGQLHAQKLGAAWAGG